MVSVPVGLVAIRYHKNTTKKALERWDYIDILFNNNRRLREAYKDIQNINKNYMQSLATYVDNESNKFIQKINEMYIELDYERKHNKAVKEFSKVLETISV